MEEYKKVTISFTKDQLEKMDEIMCQNIKLVLSRFEENLSEMLFKLAVEVSKSNILSARNFELNDYALNYLNDVSEQIVAEHNGVLDLEKARDFINGEENG